MPHAWTVVDLGFGDAGKGTITEALVRKHKVDMVVRYSGGCQCAHNVVLDNGTHHTFAQFGSGTLAGASTLLTKDVLIDPYRFINELEVLNSKGFRPRPAIVEEGALIITPFHQALNQLREQARGNDRHGSCGVGIGETAQMALERPDLALRAKDLNSTDFDRMCRYRLQAIQKYLFEKAHILTGRIGSGLHLPAIFESKDILDALLWRYYSFKKNVQIVSHSEVLDIISCRNTVWEGAQGVLLDEDYGLHPYTTWSRVTLRNALDTLEEAGIRSTNIGVLRSYGCRHGPGPFPTEDSSLKLEENHNGFSEWQREFRIGHFDLPLAKYALKVVGGTSKRIWWQKCPIQQLAITHMDCLSPIWTPVVGYGVSLSEIPSYDDFNKRERLTACLGTISNKNWKIEEVAGIQGRVIDWLEKNLDVPVGISSFGPTYERKAFLLDSSP